MILSHCHSITGGQGGYIGLRTGIFHIQLYLIVLLVKYWHLIVILLIHIYFMCSYSYFCVLMII